MDVREFLTANVGRWFSQRTQYDAIAREQSNARGELEVVTLGATEAAVTQLCQQAAVDVAGVWIGIQTQWTVDASLGGCQQTGTALAVLVPTAAGDPAAGQLLLTHSDAPDRLVRGRYEFRPQGVNPATLLLVATANDFQQEERLWFAGENLRLRAMRVRVGDREQMAFYSEIRRMPPKPETADS